MKKIFAILIFLSVGSCMKKAETDNKKLDKLTDESSNLKTEVNTQPNSGKTNTDENSESNLPQNNALTFINTYIEDCNKMNKSVGYLNFVNSSTLTTESFKNKLQKIIDDAEKEDPELGLDFDPIIDGQDYPNEGFELKNFDPKTNFIIVKGKNWADFEVTMKLILKNGKWLVDGCGIVNVPKNNQSKR